MERLRAFMEAKPDLAAMYGAHVLGFNEHIAQVAAVSAGAGAKGTSLAVASLLITPSMRVRSLPVKWVMYATCVLG